MQTEDTTRRGLLQLMTPGSSPGADEETRDVPPPHLQPPQGTVPAHLSLAERFVDQGELARGGMGVVHRVLERSLNRVVALKVLKKEKHADDNARRRFIAEAQITGQLEHPYIVPVYELGVDDANDCFFTMKLVEGRTLHALCEEQEPEKNDAPLETALAAILKVADALSFAHARNVIHRDIKPANIMLGEHGEVYMMDWGIARVPERNQLLEPADRKTTSITAFAFEKEGMVLGTYAYMSPEQARGDVDSMDARTDVFGLGAVLFRLVAGQPPIQGKNPLDALARAGSGQIVDVTEQVQGRLRRALLNVALQAMRSKPEERFSSVVALKRAIEGVMKGGTRFAIQRFAPGTVIVEEGSMGTDAYIMRSGECDVIHGSGSARMLMGRLEPGAVFGETAVFTGQPRNASVIAVTDVELWVVPGSVLEDELNLDTWLGAFVRSLGQRFTEANARAVQMETALLRERIARCAFSALARTQTATVPIADVAAAAGIEATRAQELLAKDIAFVIVPTDTGALVRLASS